MDSMLGQIKDIVHPRDVNLYNHIRVEVEKWWEMLNIPLHALAYVLTPKYYHVSWLSYVLTNTLVVGPRKNHTKIQRFNLVI
jgi:hypothetical protein